MLAGDATEVAPRTRKVGQINTNWSSIDPHAVPKNYEEMWVEYFSYACGLVQRLGIKPASAEDIASEILLRFMERDFLNEFDPKVRRTHRGVEYRTSFRKFLEVFVEHYVRGKRDREKRIATHELLICDKADELTGELWVEVHGPHADAGTDSIIEELAASKLRVQIRERIAQVPLAGKRDMLRLYDAVVEQVQDGVVKDGVWVDDLKRPDRALIAADFGVSTSAIGARLGELKVHVAAALVAIDPTTYARFAVGV